MTSRTVDAYDAKADDGMAQFGMALSHEFVSYLDRPKDEDQRLSELGERDPRAARVWALRRRDRRTMEQVCGVLGGISQATAYRLLKVADAVMTVADSPENRVDQLRNRDEDAWIVFTLRGFGWYLEQIGFHLEDLRGRPYTMSMLKSLSVKANRFIGASPNRRLVQRYAGPQHQDG